jgi:hypothetical protein
MEERAQTDEFMTLRFLTNHQGSYGVQMKFAPKIFSKLYWKEGERNNIDTVQSDWLGTVLLGTSALQIASALDGECSKNQMIGACASWALTLPEYIRQRDDFKPEMFYLNALCGVALTAVCAKAAMDRK